MDRETLFTGSKWDILKLLELKKMSPIELSEQSGTSMANISQQLRFLEMAGIVTSERLSNRDKGKPRILYSLSGNQSFLISVAPGFVKKGMKQLNERKKAILKIWFYEHKDQQLGLEKAFNKLDRHMDEIDAIAVNSSEDSPVIMTVVTSNGLLKKNFPDIQVTNKLGKKTTVKYNLVRSASVKKANGYYSIYDPKLVFGG